MQFKDKTVLFLATGFGVGNIPFTPGTLGTIIGLPICLLVGRFHGYIALWSSVIFIILAVLLADRAEKILQKKDPGCIVIDEIAGIMVVFIGLPLNVFSVLVGFFIFRALDILKPFPIRSLENRLPGGAGVVADDVLAGIETNILLRIIQGLFLPSASL